MSRSSAGDTSDTSDSLGEDSDYRGADHNHASTTPTPGNATPGNATPGNATPGNATPLVETEGSGVDSVRGFSTQSARASRAPKLK